MYKSMVEVCLQQPVEFGGKLVSIDLDGGISYEVSITDESADQCQTSVERILGGA